jgi:hypothetical protein
MAKNYFLFFIFLLSVTNFCNAQCDKSFKDVAIESTLATSSTYANLRGSSDSLKVQSKKLMSEAIANLDSAKPPQNTCPANCKVNSQPEIVLTSVPNKYLEDYSDKPVCLGLLKDSLAKPITFKNKFFDDLEGLNSYYAELTRGKGNDGEELYRICHSTCSPSFNSVVSKTTTGFKMDSEMICNEARDKSEGLYKIASSYRWRCE